MRSFIPNATAIASFACGAGVDTSVNLIPSSSVKSSGDIGMVSEMRARNVGVDLAKCLAILFVIMHHIGDCGIRIDSSFTLGVAKSFFS